ncbi:MAG: hypothetical protein HGB10_03515 [Coriobacteriia bacterium]|nr:hypothetical protein [Coriobacteriia bacterium]
MTVESAQVVGLKVFKAIVWVIYAIATFAEIVIAFTFFLLLFDASPKAGFVEFVYHWGAVFAQPFKGMIDPTKLSNGGVISWSALFAMAAYAVLAWLLGAGVNAVSRSIYRKSRLNQAAVAPAAQPEPTPVPTEPASGIDAPQV